MFALIAAQFPAFHNLQEDTSSTWGGRRVDEERGAKLKLCDISD